MVAAGSLPLRASMSAKFPSELSRSCLPGINSIIKSESPESEGSLGPRTPITPPSSYTDFLRNAATMNSPAPARPGKHALADDHDQAVPPSPYDTCSCTNHSRGSSIQLGGGLRSPSVFSPNIFSPSYSAAGISPYYPRTPLSAIPRQHQHRRFYYGAAVPPTPYSASYSPSSTATPSTASSTNSNASNDISGDVKVMTDKVAAKGGRGHQVTVKQVTTTTYTYSPQPDNGGVSLMPAPKGKRRRMQ